ncbi:hypothetical protein H9L01_09030 [Erysipelothrix inopinata]|uniref:Uncharacterized protein n=1 Tax=Erysipelothrix inopinata TaxID=225084 RepID=A0A7G9RY27_9FIRM|nr:hypothetical protein [Erysipelothrix inopinata]QNN60502.1 hypothetical protein H9L01_09030 [Erysipelothrix inopinata]
MNHTDEDLIKMNVFKDKRRRMLYLIKGKQEGYHLQESDLKILNLLDGRKMWSLMIFVMMLGIFKIQIIWSIAVPVVVYIAMTLYFKFVFLKDRNIVKISDADFERMERPEMIEASNSDNLLFTIIPLFAVLIIVLSNVEKNAAVAVTTMDTILYYVADVILLSISFFYGSRYFKTKHKLKALKVSENNPKEAEETKKESKKNKKK